MKNSKKILISAALLIVVGSILILASVTMKKTDFGDVGNMAYETKTFEVCESFSDIRVEDVDCNVRFQHSADEKCKVICPEDRDGSIYHTVTVSDGVLRIQRRSERKWYQYIGIFFGAEYVEVYLPEKEYGQLAVSTVSGGILVYDGFTFESASLESTSGSVRMFSQAEKELQAESTSGKVTVENASPETLTVRSVSGRIALSHIRADRISAKSTSGRIELVDVIAKNTLSAETVSGGVELDECDGGSVRISSTSGSVKGTVLSEKIFITNTTSGSVSVPRSAEGGECEITTTSGSIRIGIKKQS